MGNNRTLFFFFWNRAAENGDTDKATVETHQRSPTLFSRDTIAQYLGWQLNEVNNAFERYERRRKRNNNKINNRESK